MARAFFERRAHVISPSNLFSDYTRDGNISHIIFIIMINRTGNKPQKDHDVFNDDDDDDDNGLAAVPVASDGDGPMIIICAGDDEYYNLCV